MRYKNFKVLFFLLFVLICISILFYYKGFQNGRKHINDTGIIDLENNPFEFYEIRFVFNVPDYAKFTKQELYEIAYLHSRGREDEIIPFLENMKYCSECHTWHKNDEFYQKQISTSKTIEKCKVQGEN